MRAMIDLSSCNEFMETCIADARENAATGQGGPFASLVVKDGKIIASGCNGVSRLNDPTAHAEMQAIRAAATALASYSLSGCVLFSSCEPCPMCLAAIYWARIDQVYFAATQVHASAAGFDDSFIYEQFARPAAQRSLPLMQLLAHRANVPFEAWLENSSRVPY